VKASKIFLLLAILGVGGSVETAWQVRNHFGVGPMGWVILGGKFRGPHFDFETTEIREVPTGTAIEVQNAFGLVDVKPGEPGKVSVTLRKVVFLPSQQKARELADKLKIEATLEGSWLHITTNRQELDGSGEIHFGWDQSAGFETHLTVRVPPEAEVSVTNSHGRVDVADVAAATIETSYDDARVERVKGATNLTLRHGDLAASALGGEAQISVRYGDVKLSDAAGRVKVSQAHGDVSAMRTGPLTVEIEYGDLTSETVAGALQVRGQHAEVRASGVSEGADVETSYQDVTLQDVGGDVRAKAEHGALKCTNVRGAVSAGSSFNDTQLQDVGGPVEASVSHGGIHAKRLTAGARLKTEGDDIVLEGFKGAVTVDAKHGGVRLVPDGPITQAVTASASFGDLSLEAPEGSRFEITAAADQGEVSVVLPGLAVSQAGKRSMAGKLGTGGALVQLQASHGDVTVSAGSAVASN
jgi:DUF4097 and DUF4098 domain-containing protein YvlB